RSRATARAQSNQTGERSITLSCTNRFCLLRDWQSTNTLSNLHGLNIQAGGYVVEALVAKKLRMHPPATAGGTDPIQDRRPKNPRVLSPDSTYLHPNNKLFW